VPLILGIDPGSRLTGYGLVQMAQGKTSYVASGCIRVTGDTIAEKLNIIFNDILLILIPYI